MENLLIFFVLVLAVNLMPAFGPPTWSIIAVFGLNTTLPLPILVVVGALAAATGRLLLAYSFRLLGARVPEKLRRNLVAARKAFEERPRAGLLALGLFALSPVPSAQLFEAAGLANIRLLGFTTAFFGGRLVSYSIYAGAARTLREHTLGDAMLEHLSSPWGITLQVATIAALVGLMRIDWERVAARAAAKDDGDGTPSVYFPMLRGVGVGHEYSMLEASHQHSNWKLIRLELARTADFPEGSPSRAFLLRLPLFEDGLIDEAEVARNPGMATVKRHWPNEADQQGYVIRTDAAWAFSYAIGEEDDEDLFHLESHPLCEGQYITLTEPDGGELPFRVTQIDSISGANAPISGQPSGRS